MAIFDDFYGYGAEVKKVRGGVEKREKYLKNPIFIGK